MLTLLNQIFGVLGGSLAAFRFIVDAVREHFRYRQLQNQKSDLQKLREGLARANEVKDEKARLETKAALACDLERMADPDSDCGPASNS